MALTKLGESGRSLALVRDLRVPVIDEVCSEDLRGSIESSLVEHLVDNATYEQLVVLAACCARSL